MKLKPIIIILVIVAILTIFATASANTTPISDNSITDQLLDKIALKQNVPVENLEIGDFVTSVLPLTDLMLYRMKAIDRQTGAIYEMTIDNAGIERDWKAAQEAETAAYTARYGTLEVALYDQIQTLQAGDKVSVAVWLKGEVEPLQRPDVIHDFEDETTVAPPGIVSGNPDAVEKEGVTPPSTPASAMTSAEVDRFRLANHNHIAAQIAELQRPFLSELSARNIEPTYVSPAAPLIYFEAAREDILQLAHQQTVDTVYLADSNNYQDLMDIAKVTQKADVVDVTFGIDGTGVTLGILEDSRIEFDNPYLNFGGATLNDSVRVPGDSNVDQHATATGGMVASQYSSAQGISQDVDLYSANATTYGDANLSAAMDWAAVTKNLDVINNSWGGNAGNLDLNVHDRHLDYIVRYNWSTVTVAAGNNGGSCGAANDYVGSPARAYNVISVGNYADNNTIGWGDDAMSVCSSFVDPNTGVEKPEVAASGSSIVSTTDNPSDWIANVGSGTSYAAPMVAGESALLMDENSSLEIRPEAVKAIVMATALHNIEGSTRLSEIDGAGGVDMRAAFNLVDEGRWDYRSVTSGSFPYTYTQYIHSGEVVRAAIAWDSHPTSDYSSDPLDADIDFRVYNPSGDYVTSSASASNSFEIVEFTASVSGNYSFVVDDWSFSETSNYVGLAVWGGHHSLTAYQSWSKGTPADSYDYFRFPAAAYWNAMGIRPPSGQDYDVYLYNGSAFADPDNHTWLEDSTLGGDVVDFVVIDRNHAPSQDYFTEVKTLGGAGNYLTEWATHTADIFSNGSYGDYTSSDAWDVVRVWDAIISSGQTLYYKLEVLSGDGDLGMALFDSDPGNSSSYYQGRSQAVRSSDSGGAGADESFNYTAGATDWYGLVVWNKGGTGTTTYQIHSCTMPTPRTVTASYMPGDPNVVWSWNAGHPSSNYQVWWSSLDPYFTPGDPNTYSFTTPDTTATGGLVTHYVAIVEENPCDLTGAPSNHVGVFIFPIEPGVP